MKSESRPEHPAAPHPRPCRAGRAAHTPPRRSRARAAPGGPPRRAKSDAAPHEPHHAAPTPRPNRAAATPTPRPRCAAPAPRRAQAHAAPRPRRAVVVYLEALAVALEGLQCESMAISNRQAGLQGCRTRHELSIGVRVRVSI